MTSEYSVTKTIRLTELKTPGDYRFWAAQSEATFSVHGVMDIVLGKRMRPLPESETPAPGPLTDAEAQQVLEAEKWDRQWDRQYSLPRQESRSLCMSSYSELTNVYLPENPALFQLRGKQPQLLSTPQSSFYLGQRTHPPPSTSKKLQL